jgi:hypothetical protein
MPIKVSNKRKTYKTERSHYAIFTIIFIYLHDQFQPKMIFPPFTHFSGFASPTYRYESKKRFYSFNVQIELLSDRNPWIFAVIAEPRGNRISSGVI